ncbi:MAG: cytochrome c maturation protein CcmE [Candidatus Hydrothermarchaeales archaeon]
MDKRKAKKVKLGIGILVILLSLYVGFGAMDSFISPIRGVSEVTAQPERYLNRNIQVAGAVVPGSWVEDPSLPNTYHFKLYEGDEVIDVVYTGTVPTNLKKDVGITAVGVLTSPTHLEANKLLTKCPSKYESKLPKTVEK